MQVERIIKSQIFPLNPPSDNAFSHRAGFPIINFNIASQPNLLDTKTVRLCGTYRIQHPDGTNADPIHPTNTLNGNPLFNGMSTDSRVGIPSAFQQLTIATQTNQSLEVIRNYGRYLSSAIPVTHSQSDLDTNQTMGNPASSSRSFNGAHQLNNDVSFCLPLRCGMFEGGNTIPLGVNGVRGLNISLEIAPDSNALSGYQTYDAVTNELAVNQIIAPLGQGMYYELIDLSLTYDVLVLDETSTNAMSVPATGQLEYNSVSQLYGVLNSSDQTMNYNLGLHNAKKIWHNFIPTSHINKYTANGMGTDRLKNNTNGNYADTANIRRISYIRGGQKFPLDFTIDVNTQALENRPQTELETKFIDSIKSLNEYDHSCISLNSQNAIGDNITFDNTAFPRNNQTLIDPRPIFGCGINIDPLSRWGVDYSQTNYAIRVESDLDGVSPNSMYTFVVSRNVLQYSPNGIIVSS